MESTANPKLELMANRAYQNHVCSNATRNCAKYKSHLISQEMETNEKLKDLKDRFDGCLKLSLLTLCF